MFERFRRWRRGAPIVFLHEFRTPPYGGGNQFLLALRGEFARRGIAVGEGHVGPDTEVVLFNSHHADPARLRRLRRPNLRMIHRVDGPIAVYRGTDDGTDQRVLGLNHEFADATIFQSVYSRDKHLALGFTVREPHVIVNASDPAVFFAADRPAPERRLRVIASAWSDNPRKGGPVYQWLDTQLNQERFQFTFVGRIAESLPNSRVLGAIPSAELAALLRQQDVYLTASEHESCSNALIEALSCGLPAVYRRSGSNEELVRQGGLGFDHHEQIPELLEQMRTDYAAFRSRIEAPRLADVATEYLRVMRARTL